MAGRGGVGWGSMKGSATWRCKELQLLPAPGELPPSAAAAGAAPTRAQRQQAGVGHRVAEGRQQRRQPPLAGPRWRGSVREAMRRWDGCWGGRADRAAGAAWAPRRRRPLEQRLAVRQQCLPPAGPEQSRGALAAGWPPGGGLLHGGRAAASAYNACSQIASREQNKGRQAERGWVGRRRISTAAIDIPAPHLVFPSNSLVQPCWLRPRSQLARPRAPCGQGRAPAAGGPWRPCSPPGGRQRGASPSGQPA